MASADFLNEAIRRDLACPAFGAILPPDLFEQARTWQRHCHTNGFAGIHWPVAHGGRGLSNDHYQVWAVECAKQAITPYMNFQGFVLAGPAILRHGTAEQQQQFLASTLSADLIWCQLFSEPESGSDLASLSTTAVPNVDGGWSVTGQKVWSSTAQFADWAILLARTDPDLPSHRGISFFLFDMAAPGVEVRPIKQMTGDSEFCEVFLDQAPVLPEQLLGSLHQGWTVAMSVLADERSGAASAGIVLDRQLANLKSSLRPPWRSADGSIESRAVLNDRLMTLHGRGSALGHLFARSTDRIDGYGPNLGPLTKLGRSELDAQMTELALDGGGAHGMIESDLTDAFLYAPGMRVAGGTSEIQRNLIGERLLGLPRQPRPDEQESRG